MAKDFNDINPDTEYEVNNDVGSDSGNDIANDTGVDLNAETEEYAKTGKIKQFVAGGLAVIAGSTALAFNRDNSNYTDISPAQSWQQGVSMDDIGTDLENDMTREREAEELNNTPSKPEYGEYDDKNS